MQRRVQGVAAPGRTELRPLRNGADENFTVLVVCVYVAVVAELRVGVVCAILTDLMVPGCEQLFQSDLMVPGRTLDGLL